MNTTLALPSSRRMHGDRGPPRRLVAKDVKTRAAAARAVALVGTWDDIDRLVTMAKTEKSSAVRLWTAAAAGDIACRYRGAHGQKAMSKAQRRQLMEWLKGFDPGGNSGLLMLLAAAADATAVGRLGRMLRDPRNGVRAGALLAIRRMALSAANLELGALRTAMHEWFADRRLSPDVIVALVTLVGQVGWPGFEQHVRQAASMGKPHHEASSVAMDRLNARKDVANWDGLWASDGLDVLELGEPRWTRLMTIGGGTVSIEAGDARDVSIEPKPKLGSDPMRMVFSPRAGQTKSKPALQFAGATWWKYDEMPLAELVDTRHAELTGYAAASLQAVRDQLRPLDSVIAKRAVGLLAWRQGLLEEAAAILGKLASVKRPRAELHWWLACVHADRGDNEAAAVSVAAYLAKAGKKGIWRADAEALQARL